MRRQKKPPNLLLMQPAWGDLYGNFRKAARKAILYPPLGLCYIGAVAKEKGWNVRLLDGEVHPLTPKNLQKVLAEFPPDLVGITCTTPLYPEARKVAELVKQFSCAPIILGGPHITLQAERVLQECEHIDYGVVGEGEATFSQFLDAFLLKDEVELTSIDGLIGRNSKGIVKGKPRALLSDLDQLPFPDRSLLKNDAYYWSVPHRGKLKFTTLSSARGCPFACVFCSEHTMFGRSVRFRSPENVVEEIDFLVNRMKLNMIGFVDDTFTLDKERVIDLCERIQARKLDVKMDCWTHANTVDEKVLSAMKEAGFVRVCFGIESGDPEVLKRTRKNVTLERLREAFRLAKKVGLETCGYAILGLPFETRESAMNTIRFMQSLTTMDYGFFSIASPLPGTEMYEMAKRGEGGLRLLTEDERDFKRYDASVIEVNDLDAKELTRLQRIGFLKVYLAPRRIWYLLRRVPLKETITYILAFLESVFKIKLGGFRFLRPTSRSSQKREGRIQSGDRSYKESLAV